MSIKRRPGDRLEPGGLGTATTAHILEDVLPALAARLGASRLAELEVRSADWRIRLRRGLQPRAEAEVSRVAPRAAPAAPRSDDADPGMARSPAVGYFMAAPGLATGHPVRAGDALGRVDMLGVLQDVVAPRDGVVGRLLVEQGQAVEFGQELVLVEALTRQPDTAGNDEPSGQAGVAD